MEMKLQSDMVEGREAFTRFAEAMRAVVSVPHSRMKELMDEHKREADKNPKKRGPKRKSA